MNKIINSCNERSGVDKKEIIELEMSEDLEHLPNSRPLKIWLRCIGELTEGLDTKSNKINLSKFADFYGDLTREEQEIFVRMGSGCGRRLKNITDLLDFAYEGTVCFKKNDNEVKLSINAQIKIC